MTVSMRNRFCCLHYCVALVFTTECELSIDGIYMNYSIMFRCILFFHEIHIFHSFLLGFTSKRIYHSLYELQSITLC